MRERGGELSKVYCITARRIVETGKEESMEEKETDILMLEHAVFEVS
jgi:hypothetical protein